MRKKLAITAIFLALISVFAVFDYYRAKQFNIQVVSIDPQPAKADGRTPVHMKLKLTGLGGKPVEGHDLFAIPLKGGSFKVQRIRTNEEGEADFSYYPYLANSFLKAENVPVKVIDESNSMFIAIPAKAFVEIKLVEPDKAAESKYDLNNILGD